MNNQGEDQLILISQLYPCLYTQAASAGEGETKPRRRRKKSKGEQSGVVSKKRKLSAEQVNMLEMNFGSEHKLESERKDRIASELGLDPRQVAVWFQNRRARWKSKKLEEEYSKLKTVHETVVVEKCRLETEVLKMKEQLSEAEKEIQRLSERVLEGVSSGSPASSSHSVDLGSRLVGDFGNLFYFPENNYIHEIEWMTLYGL